MSYGHSKRGDFRQARTSQSLEPGQSYGPPGAKPASPGMRPLVKAQPTQAPVQRRSLQDRIPRVEAPKGPVTAWTNAVFRPDLYKAPDLPKSSKDTGPGTVVSDAPAGATAQAEASAAATAPAQAEASTAVTAPAQAEASTAATVPEQEQDASRSETEQLTDAPSQRYIVPFDRNPLAAPGERIIFRAEFTDPSPANYQLEFSTTGGHFNSASGPATVTRPGLTSGNLDFFVPSPWDGRSAVQVVLKLKKVSDGSVLQTETWNFGLKAYYPTTMRQREGTGKRPLPAVYTYDIGPARPSGTAPFYQHQTILERFHNWGLANITPADIDPTYRTTHSLTNTAAINQHFLGNYAGNNGTFTVDGNDRIADQHGGHPNLSNLVSHLVAPKEIEVALPQVYEAQPGTTLGSYTVTRVLEADGTTWKVKKG